jgi:hypothetical protein
MHRSKSAALTILFLLFLAAPSMARDLTFDERVRAQEAIERVHYRHQTGATKTFEQAVSRDVLERKVETYLKRSVALETIWRTPVTAEMLQREMERQAKGTRMPERLQELYAALGDDPVLVAECLARPALVDRLSESFFAYDGSIHQEARRAAEALQRQAVDPAAGHPSRSVYEVTAEARARVRASLPEKTGVFGPLREDRDSFFFEAILSDDDAGLRVARLTVAKEDFGAWWSRAAGSLDARPMRAAEASAYRLPAPASGSSEEAPLSVDSWTAIGGDEQPPVPRTLMA